MVTLDLSISKNEMIEIILMKEMEEQCHKRVHVIIRLEKEVLLQAVILEVDVKALAV